MRRHLWVFAALVLLAFALRLRDVDRYDLWYDEAGQALAALKPTLAETLQVVRRHHGASPLSYLLTAVAIRLGGTSELALRFEPLFWSVLSVALTIRAARALAPRGAAWAGLLAALSPFAIRYAQEVRFYALGLMWASAVFCVAALVATGALHRRWTTWLLLVGLTTALLYSHAYSVFIALPALIVAILSVPARERLRVALWQTSAYALAGLLFAPWFFGGMKVAAHPFGTHTLTPEAVRSVWAGLEVVPLVPSPPTHVADGLFAVATLGLSVLALIYAAARVRHAPWLAGGVLGIGLAVAAVCAATLAVGYFFHPRQFLFLQPVRFVLLSAALASASQAVPSALRGLLAIGLLGLSVMYTNADLHRLERARLRPVAQAVAAHASAPGTPAFIVPFWVYVAPEYYLHMMGVEVAWQRLPGDQLAAEQLSAAPKGALFLIPTGRADLLPLLNAAGFYEVALPPSPTPPDFRVLVKDGA
ncbi:MAG: glycosyltransferase family 39 protein [Anaerolineae bacterium]|nr:glycosyltransferase family 39 protein [Anaerolineae bacterium]